MKLLAERWGPFLTSRPETGMGFWTANITLLDGRRFEDVIIDGGYISKIRGRSDIPFEADDVADIEVTGRRWAWTE